MADYTVLDVKSDLSGMLKGTTSDKIPGILSILKRAGRQLLLDIDPDESRRTMEITNALYDQVFDYPLPSDVKGDRVIDIRPYVNRDWKFQQRNAESFDFDKEATTFVVEYNSGVKSIRISAPITAPRTIDQFTSLTDGGTWAVGDDATNLTLDTLNFVQGSSSINFDMSGVGTTAFVEKTYTTTIDMSADEDISALFLYVYFPDSSAITNVNLRWGDSATVYWNRTVTQAQDGAFHNGWNLLRFDWNGATQTGSPTSSAFKYARITITYDGTAETDIRLDNLVSTRGKIFEIEYYSKFLYTTTAGVYQEDPLNDSDIVKLDTDSYNIYLNKVAEFACQTVQKLNADLPYFKKEYNDGVISYQSSRKSERKKSQEIYYTPLKRS